MTERLILARHAQVDSRYAGRFLGSTDAPLSDLGRRQAAALAGTVRRKHVDAFCASPLRRARQTAELLGAEAQSDADLREIDFGRWEGCSFEEISTGGQAERIDRWRRFDLEFCFPGGESLGGFVARVARAADRLAAGPSKTTLAVTHGGVIRAIICHLLGLEAKHYLRFEVPPASITTIDLFDGGGVLVGLGDVCHLEDID